MSDNKNLNEKLENLTNELNTYSFDVKHLTESEKQEIKELYTILWKTYNNKIFIENIENSNIRVDKTIVINGAQYNNKNVTQESTLHFINCKNVTVIIKNKVCHITIEGCENFNIKTNGGSITGLDDIRCNHVSHVLENSSVYFLDVSNSQDCVYYISENNALNTLISSYGSPDIKIITTNPNDGKIKNKYHPTISFFEIYRIYSFERENDLLQLYYMTPTYKNKKLIKGDHY